MSLPLDRRLDSSIRWEGIGLVALAAISISLCLVLCRIVFDSGGSAVTVIGLRFLALVIALWLWCRWSGRNLRLPRRLMLACYLLGALFLLHTGGVLASIIYIPVSLAILTFYTYPLFTALFNSVANRELPGVVLTLSLLAALCGLAVAVDIKLEGFNKLGVGLALGAAIAAAFVFTMSERLLKDVTSLSVTFHMAVVGTVLSLVILMTVDNTLALPGSTSGWLALGGVLVTFIGFFVCLFSGIERIGAVPTAMIMNLEPIATVFLAIMILNEQLASAQIAGAALVISAIILVQYNASRS